MCSDQKGTDENHVDKACDDVGIGNTIYSKIKGEAKVTQESEIKNDCQNNFDQQTDDNCSLHHHELHWDHEEVIEAVEEEAKNLNSDILCSLCNKGLVLSHEVYKRWNTDIEDSTGNDEYDNNHQEPGLYLIEGCIEILNCLAKGVVQRKDYKFLQHLKEEAEPNHLASNVNSTVRWKVSKQAYSDSSVDCRKECFE